MHGFIVAASFTIYCAPFVQHVDSACGQYCNTARESMRVAAYAGEFRMIFVCGYYPLDHAGVVTS